MDCNDSSLRMLCCFAWSVLLFLHVQDLRKKWKYLNYVYLPALHYILYIKLVASFRMIAYQSTIPLNQTQTHTPHFHSYTDGHNASHLASADKRPSRRYAPNTYWWIYNIEKRDATKQHKSIRD